MSTGTGHQDAAAAKDAVADDTVTKDAAVNESPANDTAAAGAPRKNGKKGSGVALTVGIIALVVVMAVFPMFYNAGDPDAEEPFGGADGQAEEIIGEQNPDYEPWFEPLIGELPGEVESGLFALQAGLGAGVLGYVLGNFRGRAKREEELRAQHGGASGTVSGGA